jgi:hypothetical protein
MLEYEALTPEVVTAGLALVIPAKAGIFFWADPLKKIPAFAE